MSDKNNVISVEDHVRLKKNKAYCIFKRCFDVFCSVLALIVLSPVFLVTSLAIFMEDKGPVVYKQKRVKQGKKDFYIYKFRSMCLHADKIHSQMKEESGTTDVSFKLGDKEDPRITKVGRFIRKTNIDELPQLLNIIAGDMSIVGPRPLARYEFEDEQEKYGGLYDDRYDVPQGLTCYWQTAFGNRGKISFDERMQMDVDYARDANMWIDIKLIFKTALHTLAGKAGY